MGRLRFALILFLTVALDFSGPVRSDAIEAIEEFEEVAHRHGGRRTFRLVRETRPASTVDVRPASRPRPRLNGVGMSRPVRTAAPVRKIPPLLADSSAAPEDH